MKVIQQILKVSIALLLLTIIVTSPYMHDHHDHIVDEECPVYLLELVLAADVFNFEQTNITFENSSRFVFNWQNFFDVSNIIIGFNNKAPPATA